MEGQGKRRILVVDDEPDAVEFVRTVLEEEGYEVLSAVNGAKGLEVASAQKPDLVILDIQMPVRDGFATFADMRRDEELKDIPVVMLTGVGEKTGIGFSAEDMGDYLGEEPNAYVEKPVDPDALAKTVKRLLGE